VLGTHDGYIPRHMTSQKKYHVQSSDPDLFLMGCYRNTRSKGTMGVPAELVGTWVFLAIEFHRAGHYDDNDKEICHGRHGK
jgi:hypothetical protein